MPYRPTAAPRQVEDRIVALIEREIDDAGSGP
jgi:hypothetical protein